MTPRLIVLVVGLVLLATQPSRAVEVQSVVSPGGVEAWLLEDHSNPIISMDLAFVGGAALDPAGKEGLANFASGLLDEGAGDLDSQSFQERLADLAIHLSFRAGLDSFQGSLETLTENRDQAFELLRLALSEPRFDAEPVERIRSQIHAELEGDSENPNVIARRTLMATLFPDHPYGRATDGTLKSLPGLTVEDLRGFVAQRLTRDVLKVAVVGDITAEQLGPLLDKAFGGLPKSGTAATIPEASPRDAGRLIVVDKKVPQSTVAFAQPGIARDDPDFYAAYVVNYILGGGGFSSRLYEEVREKRGLAYSVYSYLAPLDHAAMIFGGVATQNARVGESLDVIRHEWARMAESGPTEQELTDAKTYLTGSYPLRFSSSDRISGMLLGIQLDHLGIDYVNVRNDLINAVTLDDARRVAKRLLKPEALTTVVVGEPDGVVSQEAAKDAGG